MREREMEMWRMEISMVRTMCGVGRKGSWTRAEVLGLNEAIDQLAMADSVCWYGDVLRREDGDVLRGEYGDVLRGEDGDVLRGEDGDVLRGEDGDVLMWGGVERVGW